MWSRKAGEYWSMIIVYKGRIQDVLGEKISPPLNPVL
jgi:hypothetical protein